ncbi:MAG TPA: BON domain-containing protein [Rubrivivax sp.]|nr:BON domain-containing protein [Burkholderiales bacterium]HNT39718.1 BON domain-containing protein [Rubrivivax sp.]
MNRKKLPLRLAACALAAAGALTMLPGCAPLLVGGAMVGGTMMVLDRRSSGTQVDDQAIELKAGMRVRELGLPAHVNVTSYNRVMLITGEVPSQADRQTIEQHLSRIDAVRSVVNELAVTENSTVGSRTSDSVITSKVKASFVDAKDLQAQAGKVVTERGVVYLMGRVTEREAARFADVARTVEGVRKVVRVFEIISEAELAAMQPKP